MPIGSLLLGLALAILIVPVVAGPLMDRRRAEAGSRRPDGTIAGQAAPDLTRQSALIALRDLDFDFSTGKIVQEDYTPLRAQLLAEAAEALQAEDAAAPQPDLDAEIEAAVRAVRSAKAPAAARLLAAPASLSVHCPQCQAPALKGDRFCHECGAAL